MMPFDFEILNDDASADSLHEPAAATTPPALQSGPAPLTNMTSAVDYAEDGREQDRAAIKVAVDVLKQIMNELRLIVCKLDEREQLAKQSARRSAFLAIGGIFVQMCQQAARR
jgi:hypothetical protein